jgi:hypothetical protein
MLAKHTEIQHLSEAESAGFNPNFPPLFQKILPDLPKPGATQKPLWLATQSPSAQFFIAPRRGAFR